MFTGFCSSCFAAIDETTKPIIAVLLFETGIRRSFYSNFFKNPPASMSSGCKFDHSSSQLISNHNPVIGLEINQESNNPPSFAANPQPPSDNPISDENSLYNSETADFSHAFVRYVSDMLLEEQLEDNPWMLQDGLALQATEKSFYDVLGEKYPPSFDQNNECPWENFTPFSSVGGCNGYLATIDSTVESSRIYDQAESESFPTQSSHIYSPELQPRGDFDKNMGNANEIVPFIYSANSSMIRPLSIPGLEKVVIAHEAESDDWTNSTIQSRGRKNYQSPDYGYMEEERRNKHSMLCSEESERLEILYDSFLQRVEKDDSHPDPLYDELRNKASKKLQEKKQLQLSNKSMKSQAISGEKVDLWALLTHCAQAIGIGDQSTAKAVLKQIRQHSSPSGDGHERMAHYFANGLEARLKGGGRLLCMPSTPAVDILKAYQLYVSICPFRRMTNNFANRTIAKAAEKSPRLHIIDFGISYGFQWPCLIHRISTRPGGPPRIRITGIDLPQPGFQPAERLEETGRRLKRFADALNVPFDYKAIAQKWEYIRLVDLKIDRNDVIAVNCMYRLKNLPDDTLVQNSPRDAVLKLIKRINPDIFVHGVLNGSFNGPFFVRRFREALFHYSALFDMFEATTPREDQERLVFEREMIGNDAVNVIACEGIERVERPTTYKQWQIRISRIGFRQLPLDEDIMKRVKRIKSNYHKNFVVEEDDDCMLMGWKGRTIHAISVWKAMD